MGISGFCGSLFQILVADLVGISFLFVFATGPVCEGLQVESALQSFVSSGDFRVDDDGAIGRRSRAEPEALFVFGDAEYFSSGTASASVLVGFSWLDVVGFHG